MTSPLDSASPTPEDLKKTVEQQPSGPNVAPSAHEREAAMGETPVIETPDGREPSPNPATSSGG